MSQIFSETEDEVKSEKKVKEPSMYRVLLHNDDYTTMEFVVEILIHIFRKTIEEATRIMLNVHEKGIGVCGVYTYEVAETKVDSVHGIAKDHGFPLRCSMEKDD
ncbi:MAG: ATP-dependent Clp protease adapter ClpS [Desulfobacterales bacterium]|nr:ATP-dependent Clp protease adapter ClpS [Desulfobacterales bacterium]